MTEEKIEELKNLLRRREILTNEMEMFERILEIGRENLGFTIQDARAETKEGAYLHFLKDHYGYFSEALRKIYAEYEKEFSEVQQKIKEF